MLFFLGSSLPFINNFHKFYILLRLSFRVEKDIFSNFLLLEADRGKSEWKTGEVEGRKRLSRWFNETKTYTILNCNCNGWYDVHWFSNLYCCWSLGEGWVIQTFLSSIAGALRNSQVSHLNNESENQSVIGLVRKANINFVNRRSNLDTFIAWKFIFNGFNWHLLRFLFCQTFFSPWIGKTFSQNASLSTEIRSSS